MICQITVLNGVNSQQRRKEEYVENGERRRKEGDSLSGRKNEKCLSLNPLGIGMYGTDIQMNVKGKSAECKNPGKTLYYPLQCITHLSSIPLHSNGKMIRKPKIWLK